MSNINQFVNLWIIIFSSKIKYAIFKPDNFSIDDLDDTKVVNLLRLFFGKILSVFLFIFLQGKLESFEWFFLYFKIELISIFNHM